MPFDFNPTMWEGTYAAVLAAIFGGVGVRLLDKLLSRRSESFNEATTLRQELRDEVESLRLENTDLAEQVDAWRQKYWDQVEENVQHLASIAARDATIEELESKLRDLEKDTL